MRHPRRVNFSKHLSELAPCCCLQHMLVDLRPSRDPLNETFQACQFLKQPSELTCSYCPIGGLGGPAD